MLENFSSCCFFGRIAMCKFLTWSTIAFSSKFIAGSPCSLFDNGLMITSLVLFLDWRRVFWTSDILCIDRLQDNPIRFKSLSRSDDLLRYSIFFYTCFYCGNQIIYVEFLFWIFILCFYYAYFVIPILVSIIRFNMYMNTYWSIIHFIMYPFRCWFDFEFWYPSNII